MTMEGPYSNMMNQTFFRKIHQLAKTVEIIERKHDNLSVINMATMERSGEVCEWEATGLLEEEDMEEVQHHMNETELSAVLDDFPEDASLCSGGGLNYQESIFNLTSVILQGENEGNDHEESREKNKKPQPKQRKKTTLARPPRPGSRVKKTTKLGKKPNKHAVQCNITNTPPVLADGDAGWDILDTLTSFSDIMLGVDSGVDTDMRSHAESVVVPQKSDMFSDFDDESDGDDLIFSVQSDNTNHCNGFTAVAEMQKSASQRIENIDLEQDENQQRDADEFQYQNRSSRTDSAVGHTTSDFLFGRHGCSEVSSQDRPTQHSQGLLPEKIIPKPKVQRHIEQPQSLLQNGISHTERTGPAKRHGYKNGLKTATLAFNNSSKMSEFREKSKTDDSIGTSDESDLESPHVSRRSSQNMASGCKVDLPTNSLTLIAQYESQASAEESDSDDVISMMSSQTDNSKSCIEDCQPVDVQSLQSSDSSVIQKKVASAKYLLKIDSSPERDKIFTTKYERCSGDVYTTPPKDLLSTNENMPQATRRITRSCSKLGYEHQELHFVAGNIPIAKTVQQQSRTRRVMPRVVNEVERNFSKKSASAVVTKHKKSNNKTRKALNYSQNKDGNDTTNKNRTMKVTVDNMDSILLSPTSRLCLPLGDLNLASPAHRHSAKAPPKSAAKSSIFPDLQINIEERCKTSPRKKGGRKMRYNPLESEEDGDQGEMSDAVAVPAGSTKSTKSNERYRGNDKKAHSKSQCKWENGRSVYRKTSEVGENTNSEESDGDWPARRSGRLQGNQRSHKLTDKTAKNRNMRLDLFVGNKDRHSEEDEEDLAMKKLGTKSASKGASKSTKSHNRSQRSNKKIQSDSVLKKEKTKGMHYSPSESGEDSNSEKDNIIDSRILKSAVSSSKSSDRRQSNSKSTKRSPKSKSVNTHYSVYINETVDTEEAIVDDWRISRSAVTPAKSHDPHRKKYDTKTQGKSPWTRSKSRSVHYDTEDDDTSERHNASVATSYSLQRSTKSHTRQGEHLKTQNTPKSPTKRRKSKTVRCESSDEGNISVEDRARLEVPEPLPIAMSISKSAIKPKAHNHLRRSTRGELYSSSLTAMNVSKSAVKSSESSHRKSSKTRSKSPRKRAKSGNARYDPCESEEESSVEELQHKMKVEMDVRKKNKEKMKPAVRASSDDDDIFDNL